MPITDVRVGMVIMEANHRRLEVIGVGSWCPARGGRRWVQLELRCVEKGDLSLAGYCPTVEVEVEPLIVEAGSS